MNFSDVQPGDYFYPAVQYLYCEGAVSGYSNGTFRPYNDTTRGQLSKILIIAGGWNINTRGGPHFQDVSTTSAFYSYVETAYNLSIISGYSCGSGCLKFKPNNDITRAQLTKVIVLAEGWTVQTPAQPTFQDVLPDDPFYGYIETAYAHNVITGYSCGTGCLEFRPINSATRVQICTIIYNAMHVRR